MGVELRRLHLEMQAKHKCVGDVRSIGLFGVMELVKNRKTKEPLAPFNGSNPAVAKMVGYLRENVRSTFAPRWCIAYCVM